jgi:AcrR family transcriptional regulator
MASAQARPGPTPAPSPGLTDRGASRRAEVITAAIDRLLERGFEGATVEEICADAGASTGSVYHLFGSKRGLAGAAYAECMAGYQDSFLAALRSHEGAEAGVKAAVRFQVEWCRQHPAMARFLFLLRDPAIVAAAPIETDARNVQFFEQVGDWWRLHVHYGTLRKLSVQQSYALWIGPAMELTRHWLTRGGPEPTKADVKVLAAGAWRAVGVAT